MLLKIIMVGSLSPNLDRNFSAMTIFTLITVRILEKKLFLRTLTTYTELIYY